jgi:hypothetical protein
MWAPPEIFVLFPNTPLTWGFRWEDNQNHVLRKPLPTARAHIHARLVCVEKGKNLHPSDIKHRHFYTLDYEFLISRACLVISIGRFPQFFFFSVGATKHIL